MVTPATNVASSMPTLDLDRLLDFPREVPGAGVNLSSQDLRLLPQYVPSDGQDISNVTIRGSLYSVAIERSGAGKISVDGQSRDVISLYLTQQNGSTGDAGGSPGAVRVFLDVDTLKVVGIRYIEKQDPSGVTTEHALSATDPNFVREANRVVDWLNEERTWNDNLTNVTAPSVGTVSQPASPASPAPSSSSPQAQSNPTASSGADTSSAATSQPSNLPVLPVPEATGSVAPANTSPAVDPRPVSGSTATGQIRFGYHLSPANSSAGQTEGQGTGAAAPAPAAPSDTVVAGTQALGGAVVTVPNAASNMEAIYGMIANLSIPLQGFITDRFGINTQAASNLINTAITQGIGGVTTSALQNPQILKSIEDSLNDVSGALELIRLNPEQVNGPWSGRLHSRVQKAVDGVPSALRDAANLISSEQVDRMPSGVREVVAVVQLLDTIGKLEQEELANIFTDNPELDLELGEPRQLARALVDDSLEFIQGMQDLDPQTRVDALHKWNGATRHKIPGLMRAIEAKEKALSAPR